MSSALLYLAIVAIWAVFLIPRWIRRSHTAPQAGTGTAQAGDGATPEEGAEADEPGELEGPRGVEFVEEPEPMLAAEADYYDADYAGDDEYSEDYQDEGGGGPSEQAPPRPGRGRLGWWHRRARSTAAATGRPATAARPSLSRSQVLRARRRMLVVLVTLTVAGVACYAEKLAPWWVCVPPAGMLGMYLLLLREAALADAEQARWRAEESALRVRAARQRARQEWAARAAEPEPAPEPVAEIIELSVRVSDEFFDQYAAPPARAIGD